MLYLKRNSWKAQHANVGRNSEQCSDISGSSHGNWVCTGMRKNWQMHFG